MGFGRLVLEVEFFRSSTQSDVRVRVLDAIVFLYQTPKYQRMA